MWWQASLPLPPVAMPGALPMPPMGNTRMPHQPALLIPPDSLPLPPPLVEEPFVPGIESVSLALLHAPDFFCFLHSLLPCEQLLCCSSQTYHASTIHSKRSGCVAYNIDAARMCRRCLCRHRHRLLPLHGW